MVKGKPYSYLVESYREGGKVRQRYLKYIGPGDLRTLKSKVELGTTKTAKLGTTKSKIKYHFDTINRKDRAGNMVRIPDLYEKVKKDNVSWKEFKKTLFELEKERVIDLQVASAHYLIPKEEHKYFLEKGSRDQIFYVVWRK